MKWILDLCSGTGSATLPFMDLIDGGSSEWGVIRIDSDPKFSLVPNTRIASVLDWMDWIDDLPPIEAVWASPPCQEFSLAANAHRPRPTDPDMRIVKACREIIAHLKPRIWTIENVRGACRYFRPDLGDFAQAIGPFYLWGQFPTLPCRYDFGHSKLTHRDPAKRAAIPYEIAQAWWSVIVLQQTLEDFS